VRVVPHDDELSPQDADAWNEARWANATAALRAAGERPVVFALAGGRQRSSAALTTVMFQLLARPHDRLVDVRVGDRRVEGARAGFFFPEQARQLLQVGGESFLARDVPVHLVDLRVPRLRRLIAGSEMNTWTDALAAGQRAIEEVLADLEHAGVMRALSLRYFNAAGATAASVERHDPETHLSPLALQAALGKRDALVIHGEIDEVVPLSEVMDWARPLGMPVVVIPEAGHFFHGKLLVLRQLVQTRLQAL
jgi:pimeloyl-ACP methyl ester carboxylesterase